MRSRGQLWSLDVVLAAVVFTLAMGVLLSQSELQLFYSQHDRASHDSLRMALFASNGVVSKPDVFVEEGGSLNNYRCGPNFLGSGSTSWVSDNELSPVENCLIDSSGTISGATFGLPAPYAMALSNPPYSFSADPSGPSSPGDSVIEIPRRVLYFPDSSSVDATQLRKCLDGACDPSVMKTVYVRVWRAS